MPERTNIVSMISVSAAGLMVACPLASGQAIVNGSLTGPSGASVLPAGWSAWTGSPDTANASGPFNLTGNPWASSPDGGTFVRMGIGPASTEAMSQVVSGFSVGQVYEVNFFQTNLGFLSPGGGWTGGDGFIDLYVDGSLSGSSSTVGKPGSPNDSIVWTAESVTFLATASTLELAFSANWAVPGAEAAYMGIDGVRVKLVPAPGGLAALGGLVLVSRRRRG